jgi:hypothetical protein
LRILPPPPVHFQVVFGLNSWRSAPPLIAHLMYSSQCPPGNWLRKVVCNPNCGDASFTTGNMTRTIGFCYQRNMGVWYGRIDACLSSGSNNRQFPRFMCPNRSALTDSRTARNMLLPVGVPRQAWVQDHWTARKDYPEWVRAAAAPCVLVGEVTVSKTFSPQTEASPIPLGRLSPLTGGYATCFWQSSPKQKVYPLTGVLRNTSTCPPSTE